ncbi:MAG: CotH kinase family protein, partial [bacterium]
MSYKSIVKFVLFSMLVFLGVFISFNLCKANLAYGSPVINEIVAKTTDGSNDWIELYVVGNDPVYLGDYALVDDTEGRVPALLPGVVLDPGEFFVIQATDEDPNDGSYFVPFKLGSDDSVTLFWGINIVDVLDWEDGDAPEGCSYGRLPDGTGEPQTLLPTPNASNAAPVSSSLIINEILAQDPNGGNDWIELYVAGNDPVYLGDYALVDDKEGREPAPLPFITLGPGEFFVIQATDEDPNDGSYFVPFKLGSDDSVTLYFGTDVVNILDWVDGEAPSGVSYGLLPDGTGAAQPMSPTPGAPNKMFNLFATDKVVDVRLELTDEAWQAILADPMAEEYQPCNIIYNGIRLENVAVRTKGQSSLMTVAMNPDSNRYSFKVDINYYMDQDLFGLQKINLNNGFSDPTFMREYLSYHLMQEMGIPSPRTAFVNLYINDELFGLYLAVEAVDDEFVEARFDPGDGDLYKAEMGSDLLWKGDSIGSYSSLELKTNEDTSDHSALLAMLYELNNGSDYESFIDVDEVLRYLAVSTALTNLDSYQGVMAQNYYLYEDNGIFSIIPWDFNMSFGGFNMGCDRASIIDFMIDEPTMSVLSDRPLIAKLLQNPDYLELYHGHINQLITGPFAPENMDQIIDETADLIREYVYADPTKFFTVEEFEQTLTSDLSTDPNATIVIGFDRGFGLVIGLKAFVHERVVSISDQLNGLAPASGDGSGNCDSGFVPGPWPGPGGFGDAIATVTPPYAYQGDINVLVTITLIDDMQMLPAEINLLSVKIGSIEGKNIGRNGLEITALFDIPANEPVGMRDVAVEFQPPEFFDPNGQMPPGGMPPGGMPPGGGFGDPNAFFGDPNTFMDPNDFDMIFVKADAFEIKAQGGQPGPSGIESVSPSSAAQGDTDVAVTIILSQDMAMLPPNIIPFSVKIGQLDGTDIVRNGLQITAVFDIPANEPTGMKQVSVVLPPPPMDPNAQPMILTKADAFEIVRGYLPFTIGQTTTDDIVTDIPAFSSGGLYDETILRTIYLEFSQEDWWQQLEANYYTEENILADLTMDGNTYHGVGVRFKGMTSYMMAANSQKKSFNIEIDETDPDQRLMGYKTLNLNNSSLDPSFIREVLYFNIFRKYAPCPQANFVKLVINGENWGIYVNAQQQNSDLIEEWFGDNDGDRWKVGMGGAQGGFPPFQSLEEWLAGPSAEDLNNDGQINEVDFDIYIQSQTGGMFDPNMFGDPNMIPNGWGGGGMFDPNFTFVPPSLEEWLSSPMARDMNSDGQITEEDYNIFINMPAGGGMFDPNMFGDPNMIPNGLGGGGMFDPNFRFVPPSLEEWLSSPMARDMNSDGQITEEDYNIFINMPAGGGMFDPNMFGDPNMIPNGWGGGGMFDP